MSSPVTLAVLGAGARGTGYAKYAEKYPDLLKIVAVADPIDLRRNTMGDAYDIPEDKRFISWEDFVKEPKMCDGVIISTQDALHEAPAIACAKLGYHILLEKPMATTADACRRIVAAVKASGVMMAVCHVLRYTKYTAGVKKVLSDGEIGDIMTIQHLEPLGYWHQAHSFVRGNWRNEAESSPMLLAKSCHDVDWLRGIVGKKCSRIHSFGTVRHFHKAEQPAGAADRCTDCPDKIESFCPYSAKKIYFRDRLCKGATYWPTNVLTPNPTPDSLDEALKTGPYGRCVFNCDNNVVDNQQILMTFENGVKASLLMTAFTQDGGRRIHFHGTLGEIILEEQTDSVTVNLFSGHEQETYSTAALQEGGYGHGGGDIFIVRKLYEMLTGKSDAATTLEASIESHLMGICAEESRLQGGELVYLRK